MNCTNNKCIPREVHTQQRNSLVLKHHVKCKKNKSISRSKSIAQSAQTTRVFLVYRQKARREVDKKQDGTSYETKMGCLLETHKVSLVQGGTTRGAQTTSVFLVLKAPREVHEQYVYSLF